MSIIDSGLEVGAEAGVVAGGGAAGEDRRAGGNLPPQNPKSLWYAVNSDSFSVVQGALPKSKSIQTCCDTPIFFMWPHIVTHALVKEDARVHRMKRQARVPII